MGGTLDTLWEAVREATGAPDAARKHWTTSINQLFADKRCSKAILRFLTPPALAEKRGHGRRLEREIEKEKTTPVETRTQNGRKKKQRQR